MRIVCPILLIIITTNGFGNGNIHFSRKRVCVVGAGPSGLSLLKQLVENIEEFESVVFEKNAGIGGQWLYTDKVDGDAHGLPVSSGIYKNLRINNPKEHMGCPDYKSFGSGNSSFVKHETFRLNTLVEKITPIVANDDEQTNKWRVEIKNLNNNFGNVIACNFVIICTGEFSKAMIPKIPGIESFPGRVLHSQVYRRPEEFADQTVVILGASFSGQEIAFEISKFAKDVYLSHRHDKIKGEMPANIIQVAEVIKVNGSELILQDDSRITANSFIFCTGYKYAFPFLKESSGLEITKKHIFPLYQKIININYPSMGFVGLVRDVARFCPKFYLQAKYYVSFLRGKIKLPSRQEMLKDAVDMLPDKLPKSSKLTDLFTYLDELAADSGVESIPDWMKRSISMWTSFYWEHQFNARDYMLRISEDGYTEFFKAT